MSKSTVDQIRQRFDNEVERFSNLETGQTATMDAPLALELIAKAAAAVTPKAKAVLDVGCGAGNYTLRVLKELPSLDCTLVDLSQSMLDRAKQRVSAATAGKVVTLQADIRQANLADGSVDLILAAAVLHHLRTDDEWQAVFARFHQLLRPGGSIWIFDMVEHEIPAVQKMMWDRYGDYLVSLKNAGYRDKVFAYIEAEDTPKPLSYQLKLLRSVGFKSIDVLHKNGPFAAFGALK